MREADVIKMMEINGFELVGKSEVNANPKDSADWPDGVWTLPPVLAKKDVDRAKYEAIGETDRMTLLFKKRL
jgi:predicted methyltransferase